MSTSAIPEYARVVIIGGGIIGCSVAYHLAEMGCEDVVLLEARATSWSADWPARRCPGTWT